MPRLYSEQEETYCRHYVTHWSVERAAKDAGYSASWGYHVSCKPHIRARIAELNDMNLKATDITAQRVLLQLARIAFADIRKTRLRRRAPQGPGRLGRRHRGRHQRRGDGVEPRSETRRGRGNRRDGDTHDADHDHPLQAQRPGGRAQHPCQAFQTRRRRRRRRERPGERPCG